MQEEGPQATAPRVSRRAIRMRDTAVLAYLLAVADMSSWIASAAVLAGVCTSLGVLSALDVDWPIQVCLGLCVAGPILTRVLLLSEGLCCPRPASGLSSATYCGCSGVVSTDSGGCCARCRSAVWSMCCICCSARCRSSASSAHVLLHSLGSPDGGGFGWRYVKLRHEESSTFSIAMLMSSLDLTGLRGLLPILSWHLGPRLSLVGEMALRMRRSLAVAEALVGVPWLLLTVVTLLWGGVSLNSRVCSLLSEADAGSVSAWGGSGCTGSAVCEMAGCMLTGSGWEVAGSSVLLGVFWASLGVWLRVCGASGC